MEMINLLADDRKSEIVAARANIVIVRYIAIVLLAIAFIAGVLGVSYSVLTTTLANAETLIAANDVKAGVYSDTKQQVDTLSTQLNDAKTILNQEIRYSEVLVKIGQLMPEGTVLDSLDLSEAAFSGAPVSIKAYARSTSEASALQSQFQGSSLFSQVALQGTQTTGGLDGYPVVVSMTISLNRAGL